MQSRVLKSKYRWIALGALALLGAMIFSSDPRVVRADDDDDSNTTTPIKHLVVIFQEKDRKSVV